jgi:hypothetical protein
LSSGSLSSSKKLLALTNLDSNTWVSEVRRIRGKKQPLSSAGLHALRDEYTRTIEPARALAAETLTLERTLSDLVNPAYGLTPAEIALMLQTAPPCMPIPINVSTPLPTPMNASLECHRTSGRVALASRSCWPILPKCDQTCSIRPGKV